jgi:two-component system NtrC family response regulator
VDLTKRGAFSYLPKPYELEKLIEVLKEAYEARLRRKFAADEARMEQITAIAQGETPLGILRKLRELDDERR